MLYEKTKWLSVVWGVTAGIWAILQADLMYHTFILLYCYAIVLFISYLSRPKLRTTEAKTDVWKVDDILCLNTHFEK